MKQLKPLIIIFIMISFIAFGFLYVLPYLRNKNTVSDEDKKGGKEMVIINYGKDIDSAASIFNISASYLKALCMLECSGRKVFPQRFESHVYRRLKAVKFGKLSNYEHVTKDMLTDANDDALKNLASSWGPFQLMGYKCLLLDIKIRDIRGENAVYYGSKWIDMTYGKYLRNKAYKDAFHIHNTGSPYPSNGKSKTHDKRYCSKGLKYMNYYDSQGNGHD